jgi:uncharacterized coiled-coil protein SlyX
MKEGNKSKEFEPTVSDVLEAVQTGFARLEAGFDRHEGILTELQTGLARHEGILTELQTGLARHEKILHTLVAGQDNLMERVNIIDQRLSKTQNRIEDVVDENHDSIFDHERRITILEKTVA